ncbi:lipocalin family protein [Cryomorphaceae bacterium 1068]|nr:lipocalin family protein [Cryomorphaceae bacterium 1068]
MKKTLMYSVLALFIFAACNESEDEPQDPSNNSQDAAIQEGEVDATDAASFKMMIDAGDEKTWLASAFTLAGQTTFTDCRLDDEMVFNVDGTYIYNGGNDLCGAEDNAQVKSGTWEIDFENRSIIFDKESNNEETAEVIGLSENEIRLQGSYMMMQVRGVYTAN